MSNTHKDTHGSCQKQKYQGQSCVVAFVSPTRWMYVLPCLATYGHLNQDQDTRYRHGYIHTQTHNEKHAHTLFPDYVCIETLAACVNIHVSPPSETLPLQICANAHGCEAMCEQRILAAFPMSSPGSPSGCSFQRLPA